MMRIENGIRNSFEQSHLKVVNFVFWALILLIIFSFGGSKSSKSEAELISHAEQSIKNISTLEAEFTQISSDGSFVIGRLYFRRPFQMRLEYNLEQPYNLITTRKWLIIDEPLDQKITNYPISETPLALLLEEKLSLTGDEFSTQVRNHNGLVEIVLSKKDGVRSGILTLLFEPDFKLRGWIITDAMGIVTKVTLQNEIYGRELPNKLFGWPAY